MKMIKILDHVNHCYSNADGEIIYDIIIKHFKQGEKVTVSFEGVDCVSSSFVNSAFIELLEQYSFDFIKSNLSIVKSIRFINDMIKQMFKFEVYERPHISYV